MSATFYGLAHIFLDPSECLAHDINVQSLILSGKGTQ